jgi:hypothetical protein
MWFALRNHPMALLMPQSGRRPQHQKQTCAAHKPMSAKCHKRTSRQAIIVVELALLVSLRYGAEIIGPMLGRAKPVL